MFFWFSQKCWERFKTKKLVSKTA